MREPTAQSLTDSENTLPDTNPTTPATTTRHEPYLVEGDFAERAAKNLRNNPPKSTPWRVGIGAELNWTTLFTNKGGMWIVGLRGEATKAQRLVAVFRAALGPKTVRTDGHGVSAAFSFYGVGAELGTTIVGSRRFATDAMITASTGMLHASSRNRVTSFGDATSTWIGLGPGVRLRWFGETTSLALETTVPINVVRPRFTILGEDGTAEAFYQAPLVGVFFGLCGTWNVEPSAKSQRMIKSEPGGD
jgi:hypothetical protein